MTDELESEIDQENQPCPGCGKYGKDRQWKMGRGMNEAWCANEDCRVAVYSRDDDVP